MTAIVARPGITSSAIIERFRDTPYYDRLCELAGNSGEIDEKQHEREFHAVTGRLKLMAIIQETGKLAASSALTDEEKSTLRQLYRERRALEQELESS